MKEKIYKVGRIIVGAGVGIMGLLFGNLDGGLSALFILIIFDYITGLMRAFHNRELDSRLGFKGILKKMAILSVIVLSNVIDGLAFEYIPEISFSLRTMAIFFFLANEGLSILENVALMGVTIPKQLTDALFKFKDQKEIKKDDGEKEGE